MSKRGFHYAQIDNSKPLRRLLAFLIENQHELVSGKRIEDATGLRNIATWVSMLRKNGYEVDCHYHSVTEAGGKIYVYKLKQLEAA